MKQLNTSEVKSWGVAKKTKNIKAKPLISIMIDRSVTNKFLVDTLEGKEPLGDGAIICIGESNDIWQQMPKKLLQKYDVIEIDKDGWMVCQPKPDNSVECVEITEILDGIDELHTVHNWTVKDEIFIVGQWGEPMHLQDKDVLIQKGDYGDFVCRNREDKTDVWIVKRKIFLNTYNIIS
jgi:hypothetical protein